MRLAILIVCFLQASCAHQFSRAKSQITTLPSDPVEIAELIEIRKSQIRQLELLDEPIWKLQMQELTTEVANLESVLTDSQLQNMIEQ